MAFKKRKKHLLIADPGELRVIFLRMGEGARALELKYGNEILRKLIIEVEEKDLILEFPVDDRERLSLRQGQSLQVSFFYESKLYYGALPVKGAGKLSGKDALRVGIPAGLQIKDDFGLTQLHLNPRLDVTFTSQFNDFCDGGLVNIGPEGVDIKSDQGWVGELVRIDMETDLGFELEPGFRIASRGRVLYVNNVGEKLMGVQFLDMDRPTSNRISEWISQQSVARKTADKAYLADRQAGIKRRPSEIPTEKGINKAPQLMYDYKTVFHEGKPWVLLLCKDESLIQRIGKTLKRKYGVLVSKGRYINVQKILDFYKPAMTLIHESLDSVSGFDLARTIATENQESVPIVILGNAQDAAEKRNRAVADKAMDYRVIDPYHPLSFFKAVQDFVDLCQFEDED